MKRWIPILGWMTIPHSFYVTWPWPIRHMIGTLQSSQRPSDFSRFLRPLLETFELWTVSVEEGMIHLSYLVSLLSRIYIGIFSRTSKKRKDLAVLTGLSTSAQHKAQNIMRFGRHQILPSFWNLLARDPGGSKGSQWFPNQVHVATHIINIYIHTYIHTSMHACMHAYIHIYIYTYICIIIYRAIVGVSHVIFFKYPMFVSTKNPSTPSRCPWPTEIQLTKQQRRFSVVFRSFHEEQLTQAGKKLKQNPGGMMVDWKTLRGANH